MIENHKREWQCKWSKYVTEKSLGRYFNILRAEEIVSVVKKAVREGVFINDCERPSIWYSIVPCEKVQPKYITVVLEERNAYWWTKTLFDATDKYLRCIYISATRYKNRIKNGKY